MTTLSAPVINVIAGQFVRQFATLAALKAATPKAGETAILNARTTAGDGGEGIFDWVASNLSTQVALDTQSAVWVPPDSDNTGASGAWVRRHFGALRAEWFGAVGNGATDDTTAIRACDELLRTRQEFHVWLVSAMHLTDEFGDHGASAISSNEYNGKWIIGEGHKWSGFKLKASSAAGTRLFAASFNEGGVERIRFDGNNPSSKISAGPFNNTATELLVDIEGYGITWRDVDVRYSGGDGVRFWGENGFVNIEGGACSAKLNVGYGYVFDRISSVHASQLWVAHNDAGGVLFNNAFLNTDSGLNLTKTFWNKSNIIIESLYAENDADVPACEIRGGHMGICIGAISTWGAVTNMLLFHLKENSGSNDVWQGAHGCTIRIPGGIDGRITIDAGCYNNTFIRQNGTFTMEDATDIDWQDSGRNNQMIWEAFDPCHMPPGGVTGTIFGTNSNFAASSSAQNLVNAIEGGIIGPIQDYNATAGTPAFLQADGFNVRGGETLLNFIHSLNASISGTQTYYLIVSMRAEGHQQIGLAIYDSTNTVYYQPNSGSFAATDDFGPWRIIHADRRQRYFCIPFENDGTTRNIRVHVRGKGEGTADFFHAYVTDQPLPAPVSIVGGQVQGIGAHAMFTTSSRPAASAIPSGVGGWNITEARLEVSDGTNWDIA